VSDKLWVTGTCDNIVQILLIWIGDYPKGRPSATRKYRTKPGEMGAAPQDVDVVSRRAVELPWKEYELEYFYKVLEAKIPKDHETYSLVRDLKTNLPRWKNGRLVQGGAHLIEMDWYLDNVIQVFRLFEAMKLGKLEVVAPDLTSIDLTKPWPK
jgi:hypothetical protein